MKFDKFDYEKEIIFNHIDTSSICLRLILSFERLKKEI